MRSSHPRPRGLIRRPRINRHPQRSGAPVNLFVLPDTLNALHLALAERKDCSDLIGVSRMRRGDTATALASASRRGRVGDRRKVDVVNHVAGNTRCPEYYGDRNAVGALRDCKTADARVCRADCPAAPEYSAHLIYPQ